MNHSMIDLHSCVQCILELTFTMANAYDQKEVANLASANEDRLSSVSGRFQGETADI